MFFYFLAVKKVLKKKVKSKVFAQPHTGTETKPKSTATITSKSKDEKKEKKNTNKQGHYIITR